MEKPPSYPREPEVRWLAGEGIWAEEETDEKLALNRHVERRRLDV